MLIDVWMSSGRDDARVVVLERVCTHSNVGIALIERVFDGAHARAKTCVDGHREVRKREVCFRGNWTRCAYAGKRERDPSPCFRLIGTPRETYRRAPLFPRGARLGRDFRDHRRAAAVLRDGARGGRTHDDPPRTFREVMTHPREGRKDGCLKNWRLYFKVGT
jgi:hypothetical protein